MSLSHKHTTAVALIAAAVGVVVWQPFTGKDPSSAIQAELIGEQPEQQAELAPAAGTASPFAVASESEPPQDEKLRIVARQPEATAVAAPADELAPPGSSITAYEIGQTRVSDAEFERIAQLLRNDPVLFHNLMEEFRSEVDAERLSRLSMLLAEVRSDELTQLASDMVYSGNATSLSAGLELLRRIQPNDPAARDVIVTLLSGENETDLLVDALNAVSTPGAAESAQQQALIDQVRPLTDHQDAQVRRTSLSILSRWANDASLTPQLRAGLADTDPGVRSTATYAFVDYPFANEEVTIDLLSVLENADESKRIRSGALLALQSMSLDAQQKERLNAAERQLNTVRVARP